MGYYIGIKYINKYGSRYDNYGTITLKQLMSNVYKQGMIKRKRVKGNSKVRLQDIYKTRKYVDLASRIYRDYLEMVVQDVVAGDVVKLTNRKYPIMCVGLLTEKASEEILKKGYQLPAGVNIRKFKYRVPRVMLFYGEKSKYTDRVVHIPPKLYAEFRDNLENTNKYVIFKSILRGSTK